ncbi:hypothetical protein [Nitrososphaera viennensis]|uniref:Uncharacterized protein n=2 Tax=Nitrososphaera viennensis TaxID=1034015 RepID=A0A060HMC9_9ARCH|nr:hypothetical protein [Nitrososphaera viennensis]AIC16638.1 membrane protein of unknown function [Nitrososphaera viennensis EN76]UVS68562.1 hypothetical protein NWT39_11715 [Nitrososphaera viennensis]
MPLENKEILQADATVIVGVMVLLALGNLDATDYGSRAITSILFIAVSGIIVPFSVSAILATTEHPVAAKRWMIVGFIILVLVFLWYTLAAFYSVR